MKKIYYNFIATGKGSKEEGTLWETRADFPVNSIMTEDQFKNNVARRNRYWDLIYYEVEEP